MEKGINLVPKLTANASNYIHYVSFEIKQYCGIITEFEMILIAHLWFILQSFLADTQRVIHFKRGKK